MNKEPNGSAPGRSIAKLRDGKWFAVVRPDGRRSSFIFGSPLRAAEHAMTAMRVSHWGELSKHGWTVQPVRDV